MDAVSTKPLYEPCILFITISGYVQDGIFCHFLASMFSGLVTTAASMPVDIAKTRLILKISRNLAIFYSFFHLAESKT